MGDLVVSSPCFAQGGRIPIEHTGYGRDGSPALVLTGLCGAAVSLAIIMDDMGHPIPAYNHWVFWNIPATASIPGDIPPGERVDALGGAVQGIGYGKHRYRGPKPPFRWSHVYRFHVFALDGFLDLPGTSRKRQLIAAMQGHIVQQAMLTGHFR